MIQVKECRKMCVFIESYIHMTCAIESSKQSYCVCRVVYARAICYCMWKVYHI